MNFSLTKLSVHNGVLFVCARLEQHQGSSKLGFNICGSVHSYTILLVAADVWRRAEEILLWNSCRFYGTPNDFMQVLLRLVAGNGATIVLRSSGRPRTLRTKRNPTPGVVAELTVSSGLFPLLRV